jgi:hypothetical protein
MTAFLLAWLTALECPVVNAPAPGCLCGPAWTPAHWITTAHSVGLPVAPLRLGAPTAGADGVTLTVVGESCVTPGRPALAARAVALARAAGTGLLGVRFDEAGRVVAANPWLAELDAAADALLDLLRGSERRVA